MHRQFFQCYVVSGVFSNTAYVIPFDLQLCLDIPAVSCSKQSCLGSDNNVVSRSSEFSSLYVHHSEQLATSDFANDGNI